MQTAFVIICCALLAVVAIAAMRETNGGGGESTTENIERECRRSYGRQGERAVLDCQLAMSARLLRDAERERANDTYSRIR